MIQALNDAQGSKTHIARIADKVAGIFVPVVVAIALLTRTIVVLKARLTRHSCAVSVLVIACPCAFGTGDAGAIMAGMGVAARSGVWFKDAQKP